MQPVQDQAAAPSRRRWALIAAILVPVLLVAAGAVAYFAGAFRDDGRFDAGPPACAAVKPMVHLLGVDYELRPTKLDRGCDLWLPRDHPGYVEAPKITVGFMPVESADGRSGPEVAGQMMREFDDPDEPVAGIGDEAYARDRDLVFRVSNLLVVMFVYPNQVSDEEQVRSFATELAQSISK